MSGDFENDPEFHPSIRKPNSRRRIKFAEVVVVLGIIVVLIALFLPAIRTARPAAFRAQCMNNLKQIALALHNYEQTHKALPPAQTVDANGRPLHSWRTLLLPYLEQEPLYQTIDLSKPWDDPANAKARATVVPVFRCPTAVGPNNTTTYLAIVGPNACFSRKECRRLAEITDDHSSTLMVIEAGDENAVPWMSPVDADESLVLSLGPTTQLHHPGGTNANFVDGHVAFLKASVRDNVRRALMSISGNDSAPVDQW